MQQGDEVRYYLGILRRSGELSEAKRLLALELSVRLAALSGSRNGAGGDDPIRRVELLRAELAQKSAIFSESHPEMKALRNQIRCLAPYLFAKFKIYRGFGRYSPREWVRSGVIWPIRRRVAVSRFQWLPNILLQKNHEWVVLWVVGPRC